MQQQLHSAVVKCVEYTKWSNYKIQKLSKLPLNLSRDSVVFWSLKPTVAATRVFCCTGYPFPCGHVSEFKTGTSLLLRAIAANKAFANRAE